MFSWKKLEAQGKGQKLAWQGAFHENTMMLRMGAEFATRGDMRTVSVLPNLLPGVTCGRCPRWRLGHGQTACEPASWGGVG